MEPLVSKIFTASQIKTESLRHETGLRVAVCVAHKGERQWKLR
jgi:hypothetical protein